MNGKDVLHEIKCLGSATVGPKGQVVIPAGARRELGIYTGARLLVFSGPGGRGLMLLKTEAVEHMLKILGAHLSSFEKILGDYASPRAGDKSS
jgi:AbrB family looped-hinge helix DNA binding protein